VISNSHNSSCNIWYGYKTSWNGAVALLYPSDYGYSASSNYWNQTILKSYSTAASTNWMQQTTGHSAREWFISPATFSADYIMVWNVNGNVEFNLPFTVGNTIHPVLNLLSTATIDINHQGTASVRIK